MKKSYDYFVVTSIIFIVSFFILVSGENYQANQADNGISEDKNDPKEIICITLYNMCSHPRR